MSSSVIEKTPAETPAAVRSPLPISGIARLAAESELTEEKNDIQYFSLPTKSVLNRCSNSAMPFQWTINPYRGCEFGCKYCYARYTHEFMELREGVDFETKIYAKENVARILRQELTPGRVVGAEIAIGTATDPYQPAERKFKVTRQILETLALAKGLKFSITTKSDLVLRDLGLLKEISKKNHIQVNLSITTIDEKLARVLEPRAPRPDLRFRAVQRLVENGVAAGVFMMPLLPGITTMDASMEAVVRCAAKAKAQYLLASVAFLMPSAQAQFLPLLEKHFPHLLRKYRRAYGRSAYLPESYKKQIQEKVCALRKKYGLPIDPRLESGPLEPYVNMAHQLNLDFG